MAPVTSGNTPLQPTRSSIRQLLHAVAPTDIDLRHLIIDEFHDFHRCIGSGMSYDEIINILLQNISTSHLLSALEKTFPVHVAEHRLLLLSKPPPESIQSRGTAAAWLVGLVLVGSVVLDSGIIPLQNHHPQTGLASGPKGSDQQKVPPVMLPSMPDANSPMSPKPFRGRTPVTVSTNAAQPFLTKHQPLNDSTIDRPVNSVRPRVVIDVLAGLGDRVSMRSQGSQRVHASAIARFRVKMAPDGEKLYDTAGVRFDSLLDDGPITILCEKFDSGSGRPAQIVEHTLHITKEEKHYEIECIYPQI